MFQSPLKTVSEKIKPVESKSSVSSLKFERPSDFKKFINFIKNETKELEKIKLPKTAEVESKSKRGGVLGLLGLGVSQTVLRVQYQESTGGDESPFRGAGGSNPRSNGQNDWLLNTRQLPAFLYMELSWIAQIKWSNLWLK